MLGSLLLASMAHAAPTLTIQATDPTAPRCPTNFTGTVRGATPGGDVAFVSGTPGARMQIPAGMPCAGTNLQIGNAVLRLTLPADRAGSVSTSRDIPAPGCGAAVQVVDVTTCTVSNVAIVQ